jgi:hypothetical protein
MKYANFERNKSSENESEVSRKLRARARALAIIGLAVFAWLELSDTRGGTDNLEKYKGELNPRIQAVELIEGGVLRSDPVVDNNVYPNAVGHVIETTTILTPDGLHTYISKENGKFFVIEEKDLEEYSKEGKISIDTGVDNDGKLYISEQRANPIMREETDSQEN